MATFQRFEDIDAWKKARELTREIYAITKREPFCRDFGLVKQIRNASASIMSNIAEGFERNGNGEFGQFLAIAKGSVGEVASQLYIVLDQGYIDKPTFNRILSLTADVGRRVSGLMSYLRQSDFRGAKYNRASAPLVKTRKSKPATPNTRHPR
jgi:four helix bundle protein